MTSIAALLQTMRTVTIFNGLILFGSITVSYRKIYSSVKRLKRLNALLLLGVAVVGGTFGGRLFQKIRIPQVVGYITMGILIGATGL
ncbi:MAG: hypothetical protein A2268_03650 [Candidatus Raymondbacteria bacterium RifOxyA12_full_50_37]|nr:MAG: hypothetical protein A2268_03650 [Candidatus Raymondbacteria bacterium RifOxyA12_full_50_37]OGJ91888.1 MAG: hypothetical protein A2248_04720 [Candidatus Raymondbacteria bacterium RIFOXYA2_FULL_49_16]OGK02339.1 MAG: hypothetical protein A2350_03135 [Candidatus Raymondbacteria bacterium RifOxyB12_full_50_8]OGK07961.1 MAG: hypothetical protein A2487_12625 [Candidatus Raymondbacteria bacterium RifOxyC12_full_50_8]OGP43994.1 MAG: hypothetical protein A2324_12770 [Candidatus Raymondbacteria b